MTHDQHQRSLRDSHAIWTWAWTDGRVMYTRDGRTKAQAWADLSHDHPELRATGTLDFMGRYAGMDVAVAAWDAIRALRRQHGPCITFTTF